MLFKWLTENHPKKLKDLLDNNTAVERNLTSVCSIVRNNVWSEDVEKQIMDLNVGFTSEFVKLVLENLASEPNKAFTFFMRVEKCGMFKHDGGTYNAMMRVLGREGPIDSFLCCFWMLLVDMRSAGFEIEFEIFAMVAGTLCERKMMWGAVELYRFAMEGAIKPSPPWCTFLLRKITSSKELDINLFRRVLKVFTDVMGEAVVESLTLGRMCWF